MAAGRWIEVTVAASGTTSDAVDIGENFKNVLVLIPALDSATVEIHVSNALAGTYYAMEVLDMDATGSFNHATTADTAAKAVIFMCGSQYIKVVCSAAQTSAERTFWVRGIS